MLISSGYDQQIKFWSDFNNTKCKHVFEVKEGPINALEMVPNKDEIAFAVNNSVKFLDLASLNPTQSNSIDSHNGIVSSILFTKEIDYLYFSAGEDCFVKLNDRRVGKPVRDFDHQGYINSICLGNDNVSLYFNNISKNL